jgi:hypothetical protein
MSFAFRKSLPSLSGLSEKMQTARHPICGAIAWAALEECRQMVPTFSSIRDF